MKGGHNPPVTSVRTQRLWVDTKCYKADMSVQYKPAGNKDTSSRNGDWYFFCGVSGGHHKHQWLSNEQWYWENGNVNVINNMDTNVYWVKKLRVALIPIQLTDYKQLCWTGEWIQHWKAVRSIPRHYQKA